MPITALPTPPSRQDPANFSSRGDAFMAALPTFATEANALQTDVNAKQASAATSETNALAHKNAAATSEANALTYKNAAATSEANALASANSAAASYDSFDDRYLGPKAAAPTLDNDGQALLVGALYWNTTTALMYVWTGSAWVSSLNPLVVPDNQFRITGSVDATKIAMFDVDGLTTGVTRTYALPDASTTLVGTDVTQVLTNKSFGDNPVFSVGAANGVPYLNAAKVLTSGSALTFDGATLKIASDNAIIRLHATVDTGHARIDYLDETSTVRWSAGYRDGTNGYEIRANDALGGGAGITLGIDGTATWNSATSELMKLTAVGLGIGGAASERLSVIGTSPVVGIRDGGPGQSAALKFFDNAGATKGGFTCESGFLTGFIGAVEVLRLTVGSLLVGKTSSNSATVGVELAPGGGLTSTSDSNHAQTLNRNSSDGVLAYFLRQNVVVGSISVTSAATTYNTSSDYRLKTIDGPVENSGAFIDALRPVRGSWKVDGSPFVGFLAHEFQVVSPSSVTGVKDAVDANGNPIHQSMQASSPEVMANVIAELQFLRARTARLETLH